MDRSPAQTALLSASQVLDPSRSVPAVLERAGAKALFAAEGSIGDVVELVELLCLAILSTPIEGTKNVGKIQNTVGELLGATIQTRFEDESRCQCLRVFRSTREGICFAVSVGQE